MGNVVQNVTATTSTEELQERNGEKNQRVYDPQQELLMLEVLRELKQMNKHLEVITGESFDES